MASDAVSTGPTYRLLPADEWSQLTPIFEAHGSRVPSLGHILAAEVDGRIVGFLTLQVALHAEPLWIEPAHRGRVSYRRMARLLEQQIPGCTYYVFAPSERIARLAELGGMTRLPWAVFQREVPSCRS